MTAFTVKKLLSILVHPTTGLLVLMLVVLLLTRKRSRFARRLLLISVVALLAMSSSVVSNLIVGPLENRTQVLMELPESTGLILVLGSGHYYTETRPPNSVLSAVALSRLTEGVRLWKQNPSVSLALSGAAFGNQISHAEAMSNAAISMGVAEDKIIRYEDALDTEAEISLAVEYLLSEQRLSASADSSVSSQKNQLVVVSSATHLPRAELLLKRHDVDYALAPTEFLRVRAPWYRLSAFHLLAVDRAVHEWVGMLWYHINSSVRSSVSP